jgi:3-oxoadipate enol-lactonase
VADGAVERLFSALFAATHPGVVADYRDRLLRMDAAAYARCCEAVAGVDLHGRLREILAPTLVIAGGADVAAPVAMAAEIAELIPAARLAILEGAGHLSCVEQPAAFAGLVLSFLEQGR